MRALLPRQPLNTDRGACIRTVEPFRRELKRRAACASSSALPTTLIHQQAGEAQAMMNGLRSTMPSSPAGSCQAAAAGADQQPPAERNGASTMNKAAAARYSHTSVPHLEHRSMRHRIHKQRTQGMDDGQDFQQLARPRADRDWPIVREQHQRQKQQAFSTMENASSRWLSKYGQRTPSTRAASASGVQRDDVEPDDQCEQRHQMKRQRPAHAPSPFQHQRHRFHRHQRQAPQRWISGFLSSQLKHKQQAHVTRGGQRGRRSAKPVISPP